MLAWLKREKRLVQEIVYFPAGFPASNPADDMHLLYVAMGIVKGHDNIQSACVQARVSIIVWSTMNLRVGDNIENFGAIDRSRLNRIVGTGAGHHIYHVFFDGRQYNKLIHP